jgi:hypothetical protein
MQEDNETVASEAQQQQQAEIIDHELARLRRAGLFTAFVSVVMVSYLTLPVFIPLLLLISGIIYIFWPYLFTIFLKKEDLAGVFEQENGWDTTVDDEDELATGTVPWNQIRDCHLPRPEGKDPPEGVYRVVYASEMFGRVLRTEGELHLRWIPVAQGWEIEGFSTSVASKNVESQIQEGFLNSEGNLYWIPEWITMGKKIVYCGKFDFGTHQMLEGDFRSQDSALQGRIVRMELVKASPIEYKRMTSTGGKIQQAIGNDWATLDIEMIGVRDDGSLPSVA